MPWGHAAAGYLLWSAWSHYRERQPPTDVEFWAVVFGTQFPDLIDKPLAWILPILPSGRSLGHSLLTAALVIALAYAVARRWQYDTVAVAFGVGYVSHSISDALPTLWAGEYRYADFLLWPVLSVPINHRSESFGAHFRGVTLADFLDIRLVFALVVFAVWVLDGMPGLPSRRTRLTSDTHD